MKNFNSLICKISFIVICIFCFAPSSSLQAQQIDCSEIEKKVNKMFKYKMQHAHTRQMLKQLKSKKEKQEFRDEMLNQIKKRFGFGCFDQSNTSGKANKPSCAEANEFVQAAYDHRMATRNTKRKLQKLTTREEKDAYKAKLMKAMQKQFGVECN